MRRFFSVTEFGEPLRVSDVTITLHPAGHILGSAQILLEHKGQKAVVTGDYKTIRDNSTQPFELIECDLFVTEATFGLPVFQHLPQIEISKLLFSISEQPERTHLIGVYALWKSPAGDRSSPRGRIRPPYFYSRRLRKTL